MFNSMSMLNASLMSSETITHFLDIAMDCWNCTQTLEWGYESDEEKSAMYYGMCRNVIFFLKQAVELHNHLELDKNLRDRYIEYLAKGEEKFCACYGLRNYAGAAFFKYAIDDYNAECEAHGDEHFDSPWSDEELAYIDWYYNGNREPVGDGISFAEIFSDIDNTIKKFDEISAERKAKHEASRGEFIPYFLQQLDAVVEDVESFDDITDAKDIIIYGKTNITRNEDGKACCWSSLYISEDIKHDCYKLGEMYVADDGTVRLPVIKDNIITPFIVVEANIKKVSTTDGEVKFVGNIDVEEPDEAIALC